ncbi:MAG: anaerobic ribonucleoside-triphosphate reductase activating protein [Chlorobiales bacterium]|nr:anaerobic ribonucleoside-triphosphate reductase activating protein [Chlorobiales bacterium]
MSAATKHIGSLQQGTGEGVSRFPVGGFLPQSLNDYPGRVSAVIFTRGCNFRCVYCHNPELVLPERLSGSEPISHEWIFSKLSSNRELLDAVVITGGEPTLHDSLPDFAARVKDLGLEVKLDTNGANPRMLEKLMHEELVDYIAMDLKAALDCGKYSLVCGCVVTDKMIENILRSLRLLHEAGLSCEVRATVHSRYHTKEDITGLVRLVRIPFFLQICNSEKTLRSVDKNLYTAAEISRIIESIEPNGKNNC